MNDYVLSIVFGLTVSIIGYLYTHNEDAMKVCQLSHSHDVCFQTLNR